MADPKEDPFLDDVEALEEAEAAAYEAELEEEDLPSANVDAIIEERDQLKDRLLRTLAESENVRKRAERDRREAEHYGSSKMSRDLLPVYDNLRRALDVVDDAQREVAGGVIEGVELTLRELLSVFSKHGITPIAPENGEIFDPQIHQAMFEAPVQGTKAGEIIQVMAEGFMLHDRLLRPAQVGVSSTPAG